MWLSVNKEFKSMSFMFLSTGNPPLRLQDVKAVICGHSGFKDGRTADIQSVVNTKTCFISNMEGERC